MRRIRLPALVLLTFLIGKFRSQIWHLSMLDDDERTLQQSLDANRFAARCASRACFRCMSQSRCHPIWPHGAPSDSACAAAKCTCTRWSQSSRFVRTRFARARLSAGRSPTGWVGSEIMPLWRVQDRACSLLVVCVSPSAACARASLPSAAGPCRSASLSSAVSGWTSLRFADVDFEPLLHAGQHQRVHVSAGTGPISPLHLATVAHPHDAAQHAHVGRHVQASIQPAVPCIFDLAAPSALEHYWFLTTATRSAMSRTSSTSGTRRRSSTASGRESTKTGKSVWPRCCPSPSPCHQGRSGCHSQRWAGIRSNSRKSSALAVRAPTSCFAVCARFARQA